MLWLISSMLDWYASPQGANYLRACFCLATVLGLNNRRVAVAMMLFYLWLTIR